jgi:Zn-finger nucleic acid-binding protein
MQSFKKGSTQFEACTGCAGLWFDFGELKDALSWQKNQHFNLKNIVRGDDQSDHAHGYICPKCEIIMEEREYAYDSGIHIDGCPCCRGIFVSAEDLGAIGTFLHSTKNSQEAKEVQVKAYIALNQFQEDYRAKQEKLVQEIDDLFKYDDLKSINKVTEWMIGELVDVDSFYFANR